MLDVSLAHDFGGFSVDVAFTAPPGVTALFGASGAGKTTVVNTVAGLFTPQRGRVAIGDAVLLDTARGISLPPPRRRVGYVFQEPRLFPHLSVRANLLYGARFAPRGAQGPEFAAVVEMLGIGALLKRRPGALSGGEKARVSIGRALLSKPRFLLLDEPLAALDAARRDDILPFLERLRDAGLPVLLVSHAIAEVARLAATLVLLDEGRVLAAGPVAGLLSDPRLAPRLGGTEAGSVIAARVSGRDPDGLVRAVTAGGPVWLVAAPEVPGGRLRLRIHASDVILARERPQGLSALNILQGVVQEISAEADGRAFVRLDIGGESLLARITARSVAALGLAPGVPCHAVLKSVAVSPADLSQG